MAIAKGKTSENTSFKRYIGVASCAVKAINPTKAELAKLGIETESEPEYITDTEIDGTVYKNARITLWVQPNVENTSLMSVSLFLRKQIRQNTDKTKVQVIDKYGRTAWVTVEDAKNHKIPIYANGPANIDAGYRPMCVGEDKLTNFLIAYLNIPEVMKYNQENKTWYMVENPEESECRLDNIENIFKGDFKEIKDAIKLQPNNEVKILFGVRTDDEGKQYQTAFTDMFLRNRTRNYDRLSKELNGRKDAGAYSTTEFEVCDFKEYVVNDSVIENNTEAPFGDSPFDF